MKQSVQRNLAQSIFWARRDHGPRIPSVWLVWPSTFPRNWILMYMQLLCHSHLTCCFLKRLTDFKRDPRPGGSGLCVQIKHHATNTVQQLLRPHSASRVQHFLYFPSIGLRFWGVGLLVLPDGTIQSCLSHQACMHQQQIIEIAQLLWNLEGQQI